MAQPTAAVLTGADTLREELLGLRRENDDLFKAVLQVRLWHRSSTTCTLAAGLTAVCSWVQQASTSRRNMHTQPTPATCVVCV